MAPFMAAPDTAIMTKQKAYKLGSDGMDTEYQTANPTLNIEASQFDDYGATKGRADSRVIDEEKESERSLVSASKHSIVQEQEVTSSLPVPEASAAANDVD